MLLCFVYLFGFFSFLYSVIRYSLSSAPRIAILTAGYKKNVDDKSKHLMKKERVRDAIECVACKKWRCIFAATKPTAAQMEQLSEITDVLQYSCGAPLILEDHELSGVFVVRQDVSCADPVDKLITHAEKLKKFAVGVALWSQRQESTTRQEPSTRS